jgi:ABC-type Fe3+-hydroxamate transport system substrate-binding protein
VGFRRIYCEVSGREINVPEKVDRIVSLSPAITETLYLLGLGDRIAGVTAYDVHPPEALNKTIVAGYNKVSLKKLKEVDPQLVFATTGYQRDLALKISELYPTYVIELPVSVASIIDMVVKVGDVTGEFEKARILSKSLLQKVSELSNSLNGKVYVEIDLGGPVTFGALSYITDGVELLGLKNIFGEDFVEWEVPNFKRVVEEDPDFIIYEPKMFSKTSREDVIKILHSRGWNKLRAEVMITPGPYDFLAHHGPGFINEAMLWIVKNALQSEQRNR